MKRDKKRGNLGGTSTHVINMITPNIVYAEVKTHSGKS